MKPSDYDGRGYDPPYNTPAQGSESNDLLGADGRERKLSDDLYGFTSNMHGRALALENKLDRYRAALEPFRTGGLIGGKELAWITAKSGSIEKSRALVFAIAEVDRVLA